MKSFLEFLFTPMPDDGNGYIEFSIGGVHREHRYLFKVPPVMDRHWSTAPLTRDPSANSFVAPALRTMEESAGGKANCLASSVVWIDWDEETRPVPVLPPSCVVWSGHGYHLYWKLDGWYTRFDLLEQVMTRLEKSMGADPCHNIDRIMRLPGTINAKDKDNPVPCRIVELNPGRVYTLHDIASSARLGPKVVRKIVNGDMRGFKSRSDRDWNIISLLLQSGMSDDGIRAIFEHHKCGDKYRDPRTDGSKYLEHTLERARAITGAVAILVDDNGDKSGLRIGEDGYYAATAKGSKRISTFIVKPRLLLESPEGDYIYCDVSADGTDHVWKDEVLPSSALATRHALKKWCTKVAWVWLGRDADVEALQIHLISTLQGMDMPHTYATHTLGLQEVDGQYYYVANDAVMDGKGNIWRSDDPGPVMYVDQNREVPVIQLGSLEPNMSMLHDLASMLPRINDPEVIWPMIGWFMASPLKPIIEELGYRFPILNIFGTRGSGKTTTILRIFHPLLGYSSEHSYDAKTTRFVTLVLLGSTYSVPIAFSEFRVASVGDFTRYILLAYDTGSDPRGRADQTTRDYPLTAPFSVDGEDMVEDSASLERIIAVRMSPASIGEGTSANSMFGKIGAINLNEFTAPYFEYIMQCDHAILLDAAEQDVFEAFPMVLPNRIRSNLIVVWAGVQIFSSYMQHLNLHCHPSEGAKILHASLHNVFSTKLGRAPTEADSFVELIVNAAARGIRSFPFIIENEVLWFQLAPAFEYYTSQRTVQRRETLGRGAIATQLGELTTEYMLPPQVRMVKQKKVLVYGVHLKRAAVAGLDLPRQINQGEITIILEV